MLRSNLTSSARSLEAWMTIPGSRRRERAVVTSNPVNERIPQSAAADRWLSTASALIAKVADIHRPSLVRL
jgi:hypothetical protein